MPSPKRYEILGPLVAVLSLLPGCPGPAPGPARPGARATPPPARSRATPPKQLWREQTNGQQAQVEIVDGNRLYVLAGKYAEHGNPGRYVSCRSTNTGRAVWTYDAGILMVRALQRRGTLLAVVGTDGQTLFLDARTGKHLTTPPASRPQPTWPPRRTLVIGDVTCLATGGHLACRDTRRNQVVFEVKGLHEVNHLVHDQGRLCWATAAERTVTCARLNTGKTLWRLVVPVVSGVKHPGAINFNYRLVGNRLFIGNYDGTVAAYAVD